MLSLKLGKQSFSNVLEQTVVFVEHLLQLYEGTNVKSLNGRNSIPAFSEGDRTGKDIQKATGRDPGT